MAKVHVNIASDRSKGTSFHIALPSAPPGTWPSREVPTPHDNALGKAKHKIAATVLHKNLGIVLHGHDCGMGIPDEAPPYIGKGSGYLPIVILKSSRKVMFAASTVRAEGTPIGGATRPRPILPMLSCGEPIPWRQTYPFTNTKNTVLVGFSADDIRRGREDIKDAILIEAALFVYGLVTLDPMAFGLGDVVGGVFGYDPVKSIASGIAGGARSIERSAESGWREPIVVRLDTGGGAVSGADEVQYDPQTGEWKLTKEATIGTEKGAVSTTGGKEESPAGDTPPDLFD